jgi:N-formylmaleamate deformylase
MRSHFSSLSPEQFSAETRQSLAMMIRDPQSVEAVAKDSTKSNPEVVGARMYEMLTTDLRDDVAKVTAPTLFIGSGAFASDKQRGEIAAHAEKQLAKIPNHHVLVAPDARHFVMLDSPSFVFSEMDAFLRASGD